MKKTKKASPVAAKKSAVRSPKKSAPVKKKTPRKVQPPVAPASSRVPQEPIYSQDLNGGSDGYKFGKVFLGIFIVLIGVLYLLKSFGLISDNLNLEIWQLWPVFIIFLGLAILNGRGWLSTLFTVFITILTMIVAAVLMFSSLLVSSGVPVEENNWEVMVPMINHKAVVKSPVPVSIEKLSGIQGAIVEIKNGLGALKISSSTAKVVEGEITGGFKDLGKIVSLEGDNWQKVQINASNAGNTSSNHNWSLSLADNLPLKLNVDSGVSALDLDLRANQVEELRVVAGATRLNIIMGDKAQNSQVNINAGAASVKLRLPLNMAARVVVNSGAASFNLSQLDKIKDNVYESANYADSDRKLDITIDSGVSTLDVSWYTPIPAQSASDRYLDGAKISWSEAFELIRTCEVKQVSYNDKSGSTVELTLKNGRQVIFAQPQDSVIKNDIDAAAPRCGSVPVLLK